MNNEEYAMTKKQKMELCEQIIAEAKKLISLAREKGIYDFYFVKGEE